MPKSINFSKIFTGSFKSPEGKTKAKNWRGRMQRRGRFTWGYRVRLILLALLGISIILWLSLGILLIVRADSPQNDSQNSTIFGYRDICIQCHRRVFIENDSTYTQSNPSGWIVSNQSFPTVHPHANFEGNPSKPVSLLP